MRATRPPVPPRPSAEDAVAAARGLLDDVVLGGSGAGRRDTTVTVAGGRCPARSIAPVDGALHAVLDPAWTWPSNDDELVGVVEIRTDEVSLSLVGWWTWHVATHTLRLDLACANVTAGPMTVSLQDDEATAALLRER